MKHEEIVLDPDMEVIGMVNGAAESRKRAAQNRAAQNRAAQNRALLKQMAKEQKQSRKAKWWRAFRDMVFDAGTYAAGGIVSLAAMGRDLISPQVGIPVFAICLIWAIIRIDRFVRK